VNYRDIYSSRALLRTDVSQKGRTVAAGGLVRLLFFLLQLAAVMAAG
jgi:hypothetical protein